MEVVHEAFSFRALFTALIKVELRRVFNVKLEMNTPFTPKETHSLAILMALFVTRSLLTSKFMSLAPIRKIAVSIITFVPFKVGRI